jgi:NDP-sugar pyrophosphorylase family protein
MILAAGKGTRLRPLTDRLPKALVEVAGKPLLFYAVETLAASGIREIVVNLHYYGEMIRERLGDGSRFGVAVRYSVEDPLLGSGGGILHARELLGESTFVTLNADTIIETDLRPVLAEHRRRQATATLVLRKDPRMETFGLIRVDAEDRIGRFLAHERPGAAAKLEPFMYTGVQILEPRVFSYMTEKQAFSITERTYPKMLQAGEPLYGHRFEGRWITVGTPEELAAAEEALRRKALDSAADRAIS